ncbi:Di-copper centre-containing protein, partial [Neoconidiobolus thromboides FSU 785]
CTSPTLRKEIRELTPNELTTFISAINTLKRTGVYDTFSQIHYSNNLHSHGVPAFLPWHREFLYLFEKELQKVNPSIILPYWDWSLDSQSPELSIIFELFGGNGNHQLNGDNCILNGPFKAWNCSIPEFHCLRRDFDLNDKISAFYSPEAIELLLRDSLNYNDFRLALEALPHAKVHSGIGGKNGDIMTMFSSNDPLFFLHHVFIDQLWFEWQLR